MGTHSVASHQLQQLLRKAADTEVGQKFGFASITNYSAFAKHVPIFSYDSIRDDIDRLKRGSADVLWPGTVNRFAVSSGTSGEGKHLPFTEARAASDRRFMRQIILSYLKQRPNPFQLAGTHISMPGTLEKHDGYQIGEISGFSAQQAPYLLRQLQAVDPIELTQLPFKEKFDRLLQASIKRNVKVITAVPSWILTLFQQVLQQTGCSSIAEVWPNLKLLVCGGVKLANYRPHLEELAQGLSLDFIEMYGASEGYMGFGNDLQRNDLSIMLDNGIFFEFVPNPKPTEHTSEISTPKPIWEVQTGTPYGVLVSSNAGLWRYTLNDIIEFTSLNPPRFKVRGRVNDMLDDFGEALYIYEAQQALNALSEEHNIRIGTFAIAPTLQQKEDTPHHHWFILFGDAVTHNQSKKLARRLDDQLRTINRHYAIRRESNALAAPVISPVSQDQINEWLRHHSGGNAQSKLPKILPKNSSL